MKNRHRNPLLLTALLLACVLTGLFIMQRGLLGNANGIISLSNKQHPVILLPSNLPDAVKIQDQLTALLNKQGMQADVKLTSTPSPETSSADPESLSVVRLSGFANEPSDPANTPALTLCSSTLYPAVHFTNLLTTISLDDLQQIITGNITSWEQLGLDNTPINIVLPRKSQTDAGELKAAVTDDFFTSGTVNPRLTYYDSAADGVAQLRQDQHALVLLPAEALIGQTGIRHLSVDGMSPLKSSTTTNYPLSLRVTTQSNLPDNKNNFALEETLRATLNEAGYRSNCDRPLVTIKAVGDIMLSRHVGTKIREADDLELPFRATAAYLQDADITIGNLESPFYDQGPPITEGMSFKAEPETIAGLIAAGFDAVDLANNHFGNQRRAGMRYTFDHLKDNAIGYFGAGIDYEEAHRVHVQNRNGYRIGFLGYNEVPPASYAADDETPGFALEETGAVAEDIARALPQSDYLIVSFHWGNEYTPNPSWLQKQFAHQAIDEGADMVISHHPHVVQAVELYQGRLIIYSLGNFVFDQMWSLETQQGMIAALALTPPSDPTATRLVTASVDLVPVRIHDYNQPHFTDLNESAQILQRVFAASDL